MAELSSTLDGALSCAGSNVRLRAISGHGRSGGAPRIVRRTFFDGDRALLRPLGRAALAARDSWVGLLLMAMVLAAFGALAGPACDRSSSRGTSGRRQPHVRPTSTRMRRASSACWCGCGCRRRRAWSAPRRRTPRSRCAADGDSGGRRARPAPRKARLAARRRTPHGRTAPSVRHHHRRSHPRISCHRGVAQRPPRMPYSGTA